MYIIFSLRSAVLLSLSSDKTPKSNLIVPKLRSPSLGQNCWRDSCGDLLWSNVVYLREGCGHRQGWKASSMTRFLGSQFLPRDIVYHLLWLPHILTLHWKDKLQTISKHANMWQRRRPRHPMDHELIPNHASIGTGSSNLHSTVPAQKECIVYFSKLTERIT